LTATRGALIGDVSSGSPAAGAGLQRGDVIREMDGQPVDDSNQLRLRVSMTPPGTAVHFKFLRDGVEKTASLTLQELPADRSRGSSGGDDAGSNALDGVTVQDLD